MGRLDHLRSCQMVIQPDTATLAFGPEFPLLEELTLYSEDAGIYGNATAGDAASRWAPLLAQQQWLDCPALKAIRSCPTLARKVASPLVERASLILGPDQDVQQLPHALNSWPRLHTLALELETASVGLALPQHRVTAEALQGALDLLTSCAFAAMDAPRLCHLGLMYFDCHDRSDVLTGHKIG